MNDIEYLATIFCLLLLVSTIVGFILMTAFIEYLETKHSDLFIRIGSPRIINFKNTSSYWKLASYIFFRRYKNEDDFGLKLRGNVVFIAQIYHLTIFILALIFISLTYV